MPQHARPGITHDAAHPLAHLGPVTMNGAVLAIGLPLAMRTAREAQHGIVEQLATRGAQFLVPLSMAAIEANHLCHRALLATDARRLPAPVIQRRILLSSPHANGVTVFLSLLHTSGHLFAPAGGMSAQARDNGVQGAKIGISSRRTASRPVRTVAVTEIPVSYLGFSVSRSGNPVRLTVFPPSLTVIRGQRWTPLAHPSTATRRRGSPNAPTAPVSLPEKLKTAMTSPFFAPKRPAGQILRATTLPVFPTEYREKHWRAAQFFVTLPRFSGKLTPY